MDLRNADIDADINITFIVNLWCSVSEIYRDDNDMMMMMMMMKRL